MHAKLTLLTILLAFAATVWAADRVVVEDWSRYPAGSRGVPGEWQKQNWGGSPAYDFTVVEQDGQRALHLKSKNESSTIVKDLAGKIDVRETPILEWRWKVTVLPKDGNARRKETDDEAAQIYVVWERFPKLVRSRVIGYIWDTTTPARSIVESQHTRTVTYIVVRSGPEDLGKWLTEQRNVRDDFKRIYGEEPDKPAALSISIDSNDTQSTAESLIGPILFRAP